LEDDGDAASSTLYNVTFRENVGEGAGGAILAASTDIDESLFVDNRSHVYGGAGLVVLDGGTIEDTIFRGNKAVDASDESVLIGSGGALSASGELTIDDSLFEENAAADGGAIDFLDDSAELLVVRGTRFKDNVATDSGGAIAAIAPVEIYDSVFAHNIAASGGAIHSQGLTIEGSLLRANEGTAGAGAVDATTVDGADIEIRNSTIAANKSDNHDAAVKIDVDDEEHIATLEFNTFFNNRGPEPQALEVNVEANGGFNLVGNAIANKNDNRDTCSFDFSEPATGITIAYNFDEDGTCTDGWAGTGNFGDGIDPKIDRLALNDGETRTAALLPGSPLINVVPEEYCDVETDQRGVARPVGSACDVGAYEYEPSVYVVPFTVPMDTGEITGVVAPAVAVGEIDWTATLPGTPPAGVTFPYGLGSFIIETASAGDTVTITLTFPSPINELWKVSDGTWTEVDALFSGNTATYEITDGGVLDEDGVADGFIVDPVAAGVAASFTG
jgi:predicted outer membrane repeat protein